MQPFFAILIHKEDKTNLPWGHPNTILFIAGIEVIKSILIFIDVFKVSVCGFALIGSYDL